MNLYTAISGAKASLNIGDQRSARSFLDFAETILRERDPQGNIQSPAICHFNVKNGIIFCDDIVWVTSVKEGLENVKNGELYPGTLHERYALCKSCRDAMHQEIKNIKVALKAKPA